MFNAGGWQGVFLEHDREAVRESAPLDLTRCFDGLDDPVTVTPFLREIGGCYVRIVKTAYKIETINEAYYQAFSAVGPHVVTAGRNKYSGYRFKYSDVMDGVVLPVRVDGLVDELKAITEEA